MVASGPIVPIQHNTVTYPRIGCENTYGSTNGNWFNGQIDDLFVISDSVVSQIWVKSQYHNGYSHPSAVDGFYTTITGIIVSFSHVDNLFEVFLGTDSRIVSPYIIENPMYSTAANPIGFDTNHDKWTIYAERTTVFSKAVGPGGPGMWFATNISLNLTAGIWLLEAYAHLTADKPGSTVTGVSVYAGLFSEQDVLATNPYLLIGGFSQTGLPASSAMTFSSSFFNSKIMTVVKDANTVDLRIVSSTANITIGLGVPYGAKNYIRAVCAYL